MNKNKTIGEEEILSFIKNNPKKVLITNTDIVKATEFFNLGSGSAMKPAIEVTLQIDYMTLHRWAELQQEE